MDEFKRKNNEEMEKDVLFSHAVKAGKRIYYMDVRKTRKEELYLSITESKKITTGDGESAQVSFEKHKIFLYREDFSNFIDGLTKTIKYIHEAENSNAPATETQDPASDSEIVPDLPKPDDFKIEF
ncbi:MAG: DUF3276 family protein [Bacteroidaceae bacterium]|nr:DUF3276 family protein [Bacteroidaceae bacterium]